METYFTWFSALIFSAELIVGKIKLSASHQQSCCCLCLRLIQKKSKWQVSMQGAYVAYSNVWCIFFTDFSVAAYYFTTNQLPWGIYTLLIIVVPLILCQIYSLWLFKSENSQIKASAICMHLLLCGILYRYVKSFYFLCVHRSECCDFFLDIIKYWEKSTRINRLIKRWMPSEKRFTTSIPCKH